VRAPVPAAVASIALAVAATPATPATSPSTAQGSPCYRQGSFPNGRGPISQNFQRADDAQDSRAADDFLLRHTCTVRRVSFMSWNPTGSARSFGVVFYSDGGGAPGERLRRFAHRAYTRSGSGRYTVVIPRTVLHPGLYWISIRANEDSSEGIWRWASTYEQRNSLPVWRNPGGARCPTWHDLFYCGYDSEEGGYGLSFTLRAAWHAGRG
jgi:hypothetical protein